MSFSVAAIVSADVATTPSSAHHDHQGQDNGLISCRFAIEPTMREALCGSILNSRSGTSDPPRPGNGVKMKLLNLV